MIENDEQLRNTQRKLQELQKHYEERKRDAPSRARDVTLQSLKRTINEFIEEIAWYQAHRDQPAHSSDAQTR